MTNFEATNAPFEDSNGIFVASNGAFVTSNSIFDAKFDESRYADRHEIAQRSFFRPSGGKSDSADPFLILPRSKMLSYPFDDLVGFAGI